MRFQNGGKLSETEKKQQYTALQSVLPTHGTKQIEIERQDEHGGRPYILQIKYRFQKVPFVNNTSDAIKYRKNLLTDYYDTREKQNIASQMVDKDHYYYFDFEEVPEIPAY